ncbi:MAG TPA: phenylacetate--CoA ligase family protein [Gammaproteobacteria bacterium]|nr:phenylacetate--CoA ligase family protein [Gammaproteobacteria bacterium]
MWPLQRNRAQGAFERFLNTSLDTVLERHLSIPAISQALSLFRDVVDSVPAYNAFLKEQGIDPAAIQTAEDFAQLPLLTKQNYLLRYPLKDLCRQGRIESCDMIAVSSGSTGQPTFWPRFVTDEFPIATRFEQVFHDSFKADTRRTLAVVCFALGTWVGGMYTANCCRHLAAKGYPITSITPGNNKEEILRVIEALAPNFEQVVLLGYPPFIKDIVDTGLARGINWSKYAIKLVFAGEVFSEEWRALVGERVGSPDLYYDFVSLYGTADAGVLGNETPLSICIRRFLAEHLKAAREIFGESRLPTLVQYDPSSRYFETVQRTLLFTGDNGIPLIRYHISDEGGLIPYETMRRFLADWRFEPLTELKRCGERGIRSLPFAFVFGRSHFVISYFGANIYPENVTVGLEQPGIRAWVTGKFVMQIKEDLDRNRFLSVVVELAPGEAASEERCACLVDAILKQLRRLNSEFANYVPVEYQTPHITLKPLGDPEWFPPGVKHRYTRPDAV